MKKTVLTYGLISGAISAAVAVATLPFTEQIGWEKSVVVLYAGIFLAALLIFFGVRSYRDHAAGGRLTFGRAFAVGILITLISNTCYVATWNVLYYTFMPDFMDKYSAHMIAEAKASGKSQAEIDETVQQTKTFTDLYKNPAVVVAIIYAEVFPVGLLVSLISAAILRRKSEHQ